jgi:hypothetical protein
LLRDFKWQGSRIGLEVTAQRRQAALLSPRRFQWRAQQCPPDSLDACRLYELRELPRRLQTLGPRLLGAEGSLTKWCVEHLST